MIEHEGRREVGLGLVRACSYGVTCDKLCDNVHSVWPRPQFSDVGQ
jgi:hypothetical protein